MRTGDLDALKEDFKSRLADCNEWIEKAKDKETKIRASAVKAFIAEVIMTIDNAPTVEEASVIEFKEPLPLVKAQKIVKTLSKRPQVEKKPVFKSVPTYRNYEDYHDAEQYTRGWNDAMRFIFGIEEK